MATELFANTYSTTLSAAITTTGATTCSVTSVTGAPSTTSGNWRILIDSEIMIVTGVSGTTLTITRGAEGTTAATHLISAPVTHILTRDAIKVGLQQTRPRVTNTANSTYTIDVTDSVSNVSIWHNKSGHVSYVLPTPTDSRHLELRDQTGAIQTAANWVSIIPAAGEKINASAGFAMSGTAYHFTNGSATVTATSSKFTTELYVGCSIASSNQAGVNYIVSAIGGDTSLTLAATFTGTTTTTATATRTSLLWAANGGILEIDSDGTDWLISGDGTPTTITFTASGSFIPPAGVYLAKEIAGWGGGGGGGAGAGGNSGAVLNSSTGAGGGGGANENSITDVAITPNTAYAVTIGAGGAGGTGGSAGANGSVGSNGAASTVGSLAQFLGGSGGGPGKPSVSSAGYLSLGGAPWSVSSSSAAGTANVYASSSLCWADQALLVAGFTTPAAGGSPALLAGAGGSASPGNGGDGGQAVTTNITAKSGSAGNPWSGRGTAAGGGGGGGGGTASSTTAGGTGGGGGGGGPAGQGGGGGGGGGGTATAVHGTNGSGGSGGNNGSAGTTGASSVGGAGGNGGAGAANSGAGGGGGGGGGAGNSTGGAGGNGGNGGSGQIMITYVL